MHSVYLLVLYAVGWWRNRVAASCCLSEISWNNLNDFFVSLNGTGWKWLEPASIYGNKWNFTEYTSNCPCTEDWQGLACTNVAAQHQCGISSLYLPGYNLYGPLPQVITSFIKLEIITLSNNQIYGSLPADIGNLINLTVFQIDDNKLNGMFPASTSNWTKLQELDISTNQFTGILPRSLCSMFNLTSFVANNNRFHGPFHNCLTTLHKLEIIQLTANLLSGSLPANMNGLQSLVQLNIGNNVFTGSIPTSLTDLSKLEIFSIYANWFSQSLPDRIGDMTHLQQLVIYSNRLTGPFPESMVNLSDTLTRIDALKNSFSQTLPVEIFSFPLLYMLEVSANDLTGTLPFSVSGLVSCVKFSISRNFYTGVIPPEFGQLDVTESINLRHNLLESTIPPGIANISCLETFDVHDNFIYGTIPASFSTMYNLSLLYLAFNDLSGPLDHAFNRSNQKRLTQVELNNNQFTGSLPGEVFGMPTLACFLASVNCLEGTIPESICDSHYLTLFAIDGGSSAAKCQHSIFLKKYGFRTYTLGSDKIYGTIPKCLYNMSRLQLLHLSGNEIADTLNDEIQFGPALNDLVLSHNLLTGSVPVALQSREWYILDLSYNELSGTLESNFRNPTDSTTLSLEVNRLSGFVPDSLAWIQLQNLSILRGNIFYCGYQGQGLPQSDNDYDNYQCGSNSFNIIAFMWIALALFLLAVSVVLCSGCASSSGACCACVVVDSLWYNVEMVRSALAASDVFSGYENHDSHTVGETRLRADLLHVGALLRKVRRWCVLVTAFIFIVMLPVYAGLRTAYSTYTVMYAWTLSASYLTGTTVAYVLLSLWFAFILALLVVGSTIWRPLVHSAPTNDFSVLEDTVKQPDGIIHHYRSELYHAIIVIFNLALVGTVNGCFILVSVTASSRNVVLAQLGLAAFKLCWSRSILWLVSHGSARVGVKGSVSYWPLTLLQATNNILIPIVAAAVVDTNCFYNAFVLADPIDIASALPNCTGYSCDSQDSCVCVGGVQNYNVQSKFDPPFAYSYQCSSSLIVTYVPVFALLLLFDTFYTPFKTAVVLVVSHLFTRTDDASTVESGSNDTVYSVIWSLLLRCLVYDDVTKPLVPTETLPRSESGMYNIDGAIMSVINQVMLLLTWGVIFPPLAVMVCAAVWVRTYHMQIAIGRKVLIAQATESSTRYHNWCVAVRKAIRIQCCKVEPFLRQAVLIVAAVSSVLYSTVLFDTLGDAVGFHKALWILIVMSVGPLVLSALIVLACERIPCHHQGDNGDESLAMSVSSKRESVVELGSPGERTATENPLVGRNTHRMFGTTTAGHGSGKFRTQSDGL